MERTVEITEEDKMIDIPIEVRNKNFFPDYHQG